MWKGSLNTGLQEWPELKIQLSCSQYDVRSIDHQTTALVLALYEISDSTFAPSLSIDCLWLMAINIVFSHVCYLNGVLYCFVHLLYIRSDIIVTHIVRSSQGPVYSSSTWHSLHPCRANKQIWRNDRTGRKNVLLHQQIFSLFFTCLYLKQVKRILCIL